MALESEFRLRAEAKLKRRLVKIAKARKISMSQLVREIMESACDYEEQRKPLESLSSSDLLKSAVSGHIKHGTEHIRRYHQSGTE